MKKLIIANWKMNPQNPRDASRLAHFVGRGLRNIRNVEVVLAPPFLYIPIISKFITSKSRLKIGAQDVFWEKGGAYTGEISTLQLKAYGVRLVIVGHSERRALGENNEIVRKKLKTALESGLKAVLCVGESERQKDEVFPSIVRRELHDGLKGIKKSLLKNLVVAYEPIWAIGTGRSDKPRNVYEMSLLIRRELYKILGKRAASLVEVLYGGSVDEKNAAEFVVKGAVDGLLVGGASLNANKFVKLIKAVAVL